MNTAVHSALPILNDPVANLGSKYDSAWKRMNSESFPVEERCHAYIWLGYRVLDGNVNVKHWIPAAGMPDPLLIEDQTSRARWMWSMFTVQSYVDAIILESYDKLLTVSEVDFNLTEWPNNVTSYVRLMAVCSYWHEMNGGPGDDLAHHTAVKAVGSWLSVMERHAKSKQICRTRFAEMENESLPLLVLDMVINGPIEWKDDKWIIDQFNNQPRHRAFWIECIKNIQRRPAAMIPIG